MRHEFATKSAAETFQAKVHAQMIATNGDYTGSAAKGHTTAWAKPYQDKDVNGKVIGTAWYINVKDRCMDVLSAPEKLALKQNK